MKVILFLLIAFSTQVMANDIFGFLLPNCKFVEGVPVDYFEGTLTIIDTKGKTKTIQVEDINGIGHYVLEESPFDFSHISEDSYKFAKQFEIKETDLILKGFPYQFIDGTIFILDQNGSRRVFGREEIGRVKGLNDWSEAKASKHQLPDLNLPAGISECTKRTGLMPVRFLADKIQILEMINEWERGFRELNDLAERSIFYPRPFLYDRHDRFGFMFFNYSGPKEQLIPVRYSFSNGDDFRFQGETSIGGGFDQYGPRAAPLNLATTQLKFHFLNASFEGNLNGMSMGSSIYSKDTAYSNYAEKQPKEALGDVSFNHITLIGFDWGKYGLSFGPMFPVFYVQAGNESREATPQKSVPMVRLSWTSEFFKLKLSGSTGSIHAKTEMNKKSEVLNGTGEQADDYKIKFYFLRPGIEWDGIADTKLSLDVIFLKWDYKEMLDGTQLKYEADQMNILSSIRRDFSDYVSLGLYVLWSKPDDKGTYQTTSYTRTTSNINLGGTFEFLF